MKKTLLSSVLFLLPVIADAQPTATRPASMSDAFMLQLDSNKDGKVTKEEFFAPHEKQFANMDSNKDGAIDKAEIETVEKQWREQMEKMRKHPTGSR